MGKFSTLYDRSRVPLYLQVASVMRQRINSARWVEGERISTLEELEEEFGVARVTIRQAIELLRVEGLLRAQQGRGTFVSGRPPNNRWFNLATDFDSLLESIRNNVLKHVFIQRDAEPPELVPGEGKPAKAYTFLRSVQFNSGKPFSVVNLHLDQELFLRDSKQFTRSAALPKIVEMEDVVIVHAYQTFTIGVADPEIADLLEIGLGEPTADCHLTVIDDKGVAIYVADIHYLKNCFVLRNDLLKGGRPGHYNGTSAKRPRAVMADAAAEPPRHGVPDRKTPKTQARPHGVLRALARRRGKRTSSKTRSDRPA
jgi:GntR family transcriptional regulator